MSGGPYEVAFLLLVTHKVQSGGWEAMPEALGYSRGLAYLLRFPP